MAALGTLMALCAACLLAACERGERGEASTQAAVPVAIDTVAYDEDDLTPVTDPDLVRELAPRAKGILEREAHAPIGSEFPFVHQGKRFVARIEVHENPVGGPDEPWGPHRGVTVYTLAR